MPRDPEPSLASSRSPFLRHGAAQPVNWLPWGQEAFDRARRASRPILLDIGAVWCHWCHVMDRESYENPEIARVINDRFVAVKVDRDERPDVDARYQMAVQAIAGEAGWPLTAFLTPDGEVFFGGTYFPPEEGQGRPAFPRVLEEVSRVWTDERSRAVDIARQVRARMSAYEQAETQEGELSAAMVGDAAEEFAHAFDFRFGGFGRAPKFPNAAAVLLLLDRWLDSGDDWARRIVVDTLLGMARGGVYDQLGGGFHRYSTDARWLVPHFEKMAYDNGALLAAYARAAAATGDERLARVARGIVAYYGDVAGELLAKGGFPASQDADLGPADDGDYWTWSLEELRAAVGEEPAARAALLRFGLDDAAATMPHDRNRHVLYVAREAEDVGEMIGTSLEETMSLLENATRRMKSARDRRPRPLVDTTVYVGWSSLVASGFLAAARYAGMADAGGAALRALDRIWDDAFDVENGCAHRVGDGEAGFLEDQALFGVALLDAFEHSQRPEYLERARAVAVILLSRFRDASGAFRDRAAGEPTPTRVLEEPHRPVADAPVPSGNAVAALLLLRLSALLQDESWGEQARVALSVFAGSAPRMATSCATYFRAVDLAVSPEATCVVVGAEGDARADALFAAASSTYRPRLMLRRLDPAALNATTLPAELAPMVTAESPRAYLCAGRSCAAPVSEPEALRDLLRTFRGG